jgi:hypothetical protein
MIRENQILADEDNMPIIPYEGDAADPQETDGLVQSREAEPIPTSAKALALAEEAEAKSQSIVPMDTSSSKDGKQDSSAVEAKRVQAVTTLSYYGLTDPSNQEDVAKAVQAVAAATGDQTTAVSLWHMIIGTETEGAGLTDDQILEIQQAAQHAQYSQYWLQQQFQSQLAMFENQRLMATGDNPVTNVEDARESALRGPRGDPAVAGRRKPTTTQPMLPGDWTCPGCGDHQFARNRVCRFCGASRPIGSH